jgi:hypothetical protein
MRTLASLGVVILIAVAGCETKTTGSVVGGVRQGGSTTWEGRTVKYSVDGPGSLVTVGNDSTITFSGGKIVVEKSRVLMNDKVVVTIPGNTETVDIDYAAGKLTIKADGANVHEATLAKKTP